ncbi:MAG: hypothetical protein P0S95_03365 [Rhabdochlamydiaceae bacterium]|nr:hypothetical protein [Candidatus Amphrikana amoebophyrae]
MKPLYEPIKEKSLATSKPEMVLLLLVFVTFFYSLACFYLSRFALFSFMIFEKPGLSYIAGFSIIGMFFMTPISIPISLIVMWRNYYKVKYKKALLYSSIPLLVFVLFLLLCVSGLMDMIISS